MTNKNYIIDSSEFVLFSDDTKGKKPPADVQILKTGSFDDDSLVIESQDLQEMVVNFDDDVLGKQPFIDVEHYRESSLGEVTKLYTKNNDTELWAIVNWNEDGIENFQKRRHRYFSADFFTRYTHNETGKVYKNVLRGAAVTNDPRLKNMTALFNDKNNKQGKIKMSENKIEFSELLENIGALTDDDQKLQVVFKAVGKPLEGVENLSDVENKIFANKQLNEKVKKEKIALSQKEQVIKQLSDDVKELQEQQVQGKVELEFTKLLSEGKVYPSDQELFNETAKVGGLELAKKHYSDTKVKMNAQGVSDKEGGGEALSAEDKLDQEITKLAEKENIDYGEASTRLRDAKPELFKNI